MNDEYIANIVEEFIAERPHLDTHARATFRSLLTRLFKAAKPGNWAWRRLEDEFGLQGDYVYGQDEGARG